MSWGVCLEYDAREQFRRAWGYIVQECEVPNAWERNTGEGMDYYLWENWHFNSSVLEIPDPIIVLSPKDGSKLQGEISLYDFEHPENAVYFFGSDTRDLYPCHLEGREYKSVYIPDSGYMHSFTAAAMVIYDRKFKLRQE
jgi:tRNA(Leu) C34 or U34 (ribose-2'-O)-methylase TrmL